MRVARGVKCVMRNIQRFMGSSAVVLLVMASSAAHAYKVDRETGRVTVVSLEDYDKCQREDAYGDACLEALMAYVDKQPKDAFAAGQRARLNYSHWTALRFFSKAFAKTATPEQCADPDVSMAVVSGLALPSDDPNVATARKIAATQCFPQLQSALTAALADGSAYYRTNTCALLSEKKLAAAECQPAKPAQTAAVASAASTLKGVSWQQLGFDATSARALRGPRGEEVLMVRAKPEARGLVLLKWKGVGGPWNGQVVVALERRASRGVDYVALVDDAEWVALSERDRRHEAYPKGVAIPIDLQELALDRGAKAKPSVTDVAKEFESVPAKPATKKK